MNEQAKAIQHLPDIEIPDIEITAGWAVSELETVEDCNDAFAFLMSACAQIEFQIDMELAKPKPWDQPWLARANCALKYKKAALQIVQQKRGFFNNEATKAFQRESDRALLAYIRTVVPPRQFMEWVRGSGISGISEAA